MKRRLVYGPVPSRRFGLSLGVDLVPRKTCCYDCIYCQLGKTTELTTVPRDFFQVAEVLSDVEQALADGPAPEVITLAGSGEPTLYRSLAGLISGLRDLSDIPILLLTNGALFYQAEVARDALLCDILAPSLDAGDADIFRQVNQPQDSIGFERMVEGLQEVTSEHPGIVRLEVMLVKDINDSDLGIQRIAGLLQAIRADSIDINTPVRPVPDRNVYPCEPERLEAAARAFGPAARIVASYTGRKARREEAVVTEQDILGLLSRRPCTIDDIHYSLGFGRDEILEVLGKAIKASKVQKRESAGKIFYLISGG